MNGLAGHCVIITGSGGGIGAATARAAAAEGANVVVNDINAEGARKTVDDIRSAGGSAIAAIHDIRDPSGAKALIDGCIAEFGAVTGLVNNAALFVDVPFEQDTVENLRALLEVNVVGLFNCARAAIGPMLAQGHGSIVNITSGAQTGQHGLGTYGATKGAVASFTYAWAGELRGRGVRVNAISPMASSPMSNFRTDLPEPEKNAPPILYLLSDLSKDVTGQVIRITGDELSIMCHPAKRAPVLQSNSWSLASVAEAFDKTLKDLMVPTNVATYDIASVSQDWVGADLGR